jgi:NTE family protein
MGERTFADLHLPLAITATDLKSGMPVVLKQGRVIDAVLASSAVPGVFPSRHIDGQILVDGGVMNPIPVAEARKLYPDAPVVAVVLAPPLGWQKDAYDGSSPNLTMLMTNLPLVYRLAGRLRLAQAFNLFLHSMDLTGLMLLEKQLELEHPEVIIRPNLGPIGLIDRVDIPEVIKLGEVATRNVLPELRKLGSWQFRFKQKVSRTIFHP